MSPEIRRRFFLIDNPTAGRGPHGLVDGVVAHLLARGASVTREAVSSEAAASAAIAQATRSGRFDAVVVAGGDGSVRLAAIALEGSGMPIGLIPLGTGNVLAHELGLPRRPQAIADNLIDGQARAMNAGRANGVPFLLMAGVGFDGRVIGGLDHRIKSQIGKLAYVGPTLRALRRCDDEIEITLDGRAGYRAAWAVISNVRRFGGNFVLAPQAEVAERDLVAVLFHGRRPRQRAAQLLALARGRLHARSLAAAPDVSFHVCRHAVLTSPVALPVQIDGDAFGHSPLVVESSGPSVALIQP